MYEGLEDLLEVTPKKKKKRFPLHHRALECKSRNQAIPGVAGNFGLGVQNEVGQRLAVLSGDVFYLQLSDLLICKVRMASAMASMFLSSQPVNPKGNQSWIFTGRTDAATEAPILWPPDTKSQLTGKDPDDGKDWEKEKGTTEGWDGWMGSQTQWTWVWVSSGR